MIFELVEFLNHRNFTVQNPQNAAKTKETTEFPHLRRQNTRTSQAINESLQRNLLTDHTFIQIQGKVRLFAGQDDF